MALDQTRAPYFQVLLDYVDAGVIPFHTPGHKQGIGMERAFRDFVGDNVLAIDLTQIRGLDDLLQPEEALVDAQELAAECYGAEQSFFLINGSTSGNQCMMMAALNPGDKLALPRNSHKSAMGGLIMSGATPVWMQPEVDEALHMDHTVTPAEVRATLEREPDVKAVYIVSPTYYGVAADLEAIAAIAHEHDIPLLVDEAWGPHFHFHPALPLSAMQAGADLCINSTHKMLGSMSQTAMLHVQGNRIRLDRLKAVYKLFLSTSPNLVLVASLDVARRQMALEGPALLSRTIEIAQDARRRINEIPKVYCFGEELEGRPGVFDLDPLKITVTVKDLGYTGYEAEEILRRRYNVQVELADLFNVVALYTIGTTTEASDALVYGVQELAREDRPGRHLLAVGRARPPAQDRHLQAARDPADPSGAARRVPGRHRVRAVQAIRAPHLCRGDHALSAGHPGPLARRRDHARDHRLPGARKKGRRPHARPLRRRPEIHPRRPLTRRCRRRAKSSTRRCHRRNV